jgi:hypothetical protein
MDRSCSRAGPRNLTTSASTAPALPKSALTTAADEPELWAWATPLDGVERVHQAG